jgi:2-octaprenyl-6-methoxyphenol hydroxylase
MELRQNPRLAICGAGPVGLFLAISLINLGIPASDIILIDAKPKPHSQQDPRTIALSYGSRQLLEALNAWPIKTTAIQHIHVSYKNHFGCTHLHSDDYAIPALGYVTRYGDIVTQLNNVADQLGIHILRPHKVIHLNETTEHVTLELENHEPIIAEFVIQAEGGIFSEQEKKPDSYAYEQTAIVATVTTRPTHQHRAFERFTKEGPLALLPNEIGYALVWCCHPTHADTLLSLNDSDFLTELQSTFGQRAGLFTGVSQRQSYLLGKNIHHHFSPRSSTIGNAAQTLHPVAGQGLNLGLRDAYTLANLLARDFSSDSLSRFYNARKNDRTIMISLTDKMARWFTHPTQHSPFNTLLGWSLGLLDTHPLAKKWLAEKMMFGVR